MKPHKHTIKNVLLKIKQIRQHTIYAVKFRYWPLVIDNYQPPVHIIILTGDHRFMSDVTIFNFKKDLF